MTSGSARGVVFFGGIYLIAGIVSAALASQAASHQAVLAWRWSAWLVSAMAFGTHIAYEQLRLRTSPTITALHVSLAAALAAFGLAIAANAHAMAVPPHQPPLILALSLAIWPVMTGLPAFVVALVSAILFARVRRGH